MKDGSADVKKHRWFREIKWDDVLGRKLKVNLKGFRKHHLSHFKIWICHAPYLDWTAQ